MPTFSFYGFRLEIHETRALQEKNTKLFWVIFFGNRLCSKVYDTVAANHSNYQVIYAESFLLRNRLGHGSKHLKRMGEEWKSVCHHEATADLSWNIMVTWTRGVFWWSLTIWDINFAFLQWLPNLKRINCPEKSLSISPGTFLYLLHTIFFCCFLGICEFGFLCLYLPSYWYIFNKKIEEYFLNLSCNWVARIVFWEKQMWNSYD